MSAPDPEGMSFLAKAITAGAALVSSAWGARSWLEKRFATKHALREALQPLAGEQAIQRGHIVKIFDKLDEAEAKNEERHRELLMHMLKGKGD